VNHDENIVKIENTDQGPSATINLSHITSSSPSNLTNIHINAITHQLLNQKHMLPDISTTKSENSTY
jgi:hypothetical protein